MVRVNRQEHFPEGESSSHSSWWPRSSEWQPQLHRMTCPWGPCLSFKTPTLVPRLSGCGWAGSAPQRSVEVHLPGDSRGVKFMIIGLNWKHIQSFMFLQIPWWDLWKPKNLLVKWMNHAFPPLSPPNFLYSFRMWETGFLELRLTWTSKQEIGGYVWMLLQDGNAPHP